MNGVGRYRTSLVWLRRDLRLRDNVALYEACRQSKRVAIAFVLDPNLLGQPRMGSPLVHAFLSALANLRAELRASGSDLLLRHGDLATELCELAHTLEAEAVFFNDDYEPDAVMRDKAVSGRLAALNVAVHRSTDHVYFGADEVVRADGEPYRVYTPYKRSWLDRRSLLGRPIVPSYPALRSHLIESQGLPASAELPSAQELGFPAVPFETNLSEQGAQSRLARFLKSSAVRYARDREFPALAGTSGLSADLRAGTIGIRTCVERAFAARDRLTSREGVGFDVWISELVWRDFYQMVYKRFPHAASRSFQPKADRIPWNEPGAEFAAWCAGQTGVPFVDAGMRQLKREGWMHNRLRMIVASFLTKHLLIDWRLGALHFERHLLDADPAQNNGGWQWTASTGTDAAPYFRIFNPVVQSKRFDPEGTFIRRFVPELEPVPTRYVHEPWKMPSLLQSEFAVAIGETYPAPVVDLDAARARAIAVFSAALS